MCHMSHFTYNMSLMPIATDPHPANSTTMHSRLVCKPKKHKGLKKKEKSLKRFKKGVLSFPIIVIRSLTRSLQLSWFR